MPDQTNHFPRLNAQVDDADHAAVAVTEGCILEGDLAMDVCKLDRLGWLGHAGNMIENVKDAFCAGSGFLRHRDDAAHRVEAAVEAADIGKKGNEHADRDSPD